MSNRIETSEFSVQQFKVERIVDPQEPKLQETWEHPKHR